MTASVGVSSFLAAHQLVKKIGKQCVFIAKEQQPTDKKGRIMNAIYNEQAIVSY